MAVPVSRIFLEDLVAENLWHNDVTDTLSLNLARISETWSVKKS